jgi:hypothetical protein
MDDQRMICRTTFRCEHTRNGRRVGRIGGEAIDRLGRHRHQSTGTQHVDSQANRPVATINHLAFTAVIWARIVTRDLLDFGSQLASVRGGTRVYRLRQSAISWFKADLPIDQNIASL